MAMERSALFLKAWLPIEVTVSGIVIVRWEQYSNARPPIDWILSGIIMLRNETQPLNVALFIAVIFFGIFISESLVQNLKLQRACIADNFYKEFTLQQEKYMIDDKKTGIATTPTI